MKDLVLEEIEEAKEEDKTNNEHLVTGRGDDIAS